MYYCEPMFRIAFIFMLTLPLSLFSQFSDNFSDGNFTANPVWTGHDTKFQISGDNRLWLNDPEFIIGDACLSTASQAVLDASWEFLLQMEFNPSSSNYAEVFVMASAADFSGSLNGYFIRLGYTDDDICLYRKTGASSVKIIDGINGRLNTTTVNVRVKLTRDNQGNWELFSDTLGGFDYQSEGTAFDANFTQSSFFGLRCIYTTTRKDKFFFDDFVVTGDFLVDEEAPVLLSATAVSPHVLQLSFSEPLLEQAALNTDNFNASNGLGQPQSVAFSQGNTAVLQLDFASDFVSEYDYILQYQNIEDLAGNVAAAGIVHFSYVATQPNIVVINEIMADPTPVVGLPDAEYIEIYNTSAAQLDLTGWRLVAGNYVRTFPAATIAANGFLVLCHPDNAGLFEVGTPVVGVTSFPSVSNSGTTLKLLDADSVEVSSVSYTTSWYGNPDKDDGGWSLERIDPYNHCGAFSNWKASENQNGGTPGFQNSVYASNPDNQAPEIVSVQVSGSNELLITFNEYVDTISALNTANYLISPDYGNPDIAVIGSDQKSVSLFVGWAFAENTLFTISVTGISDLCGNTLSPEEFTFSLYSASRFDVLITEIMPDPDPVVALPDAEYIELLNRSAFPIDLSGWELMVNNSSCTLSGITIQPGQFITLCNANNAALFQGIERVYGVSGFPALTNSGAGIALLSLQGNYIHGIAYTDSWYQNNFKKEGGWSLEMIDTLNFCEGAANWKASTDISGGTPSRVNAVNAANPDVSHPEMLHAEILNSDTLRVFFSEPMLINSLQLTGNYTVDRSVGSPVWAYAEPPLFNSALLKFNAVFERGKVYTLEFVDTLADCAGNTILIQHEIVFGIADSIVAGDLVINEILFNPLSGGSDFVEFYNRSEKLLDLSQLWITKRNSQGEPDAAKQASGFKYLLLPHTYRVITESPESLDSLYNIPYPEFITASDALPSLPDDAGNLIVFDRFMNVIDEFTYDDSLHFALLASDDGVSLERIDFDAPTQNAVNWHSAASVAGYATPGYQNSQYRPSDVEITTSLTADPDVFSPDNDGYDDRLNLHYSFENPGTVVSVAIYDSNGRFITWLCRSQSLPATGTLVWDGLDSRYQPCPIGIYIVYAEIFDVNGKSYSEKLAVVLSQKKL